VRRFEFLPGIWLSGINFIEDFLTSSSKILDLYLDQGKTSPKSFQLHYSSVTRSGTLKIYDNVASHLPRESGFSPRHKLNLANNAEEGGGEGANLTVGIRNFILQRSQI
jgi:hypothetical protein